MIKHFSLTIKKITVPSIGRPLKIKKIYITKYKIKDYQFLDANPVEPHLTSCISVVSTYEQIFNSEPIIVQEESRGCLSHIHKCRLAFRKFSLT